jgi:hypothetical protein
MTVTVGLASSASITLRLLAGRTRVRDAKAAMWSAGGFAPMQVVLCSCEEGHSPLEDGDLLTDGQKLWLDDTKYAAARLCGNQSQQSGGAGLLPPAGAPAAPQAKRHDVSLTERRISPRHCGRGRTIAAQPPS